MVSDSHRSWAGKGRDSTNRQNNGETSKLMSPLIYSVSIK